MLSNNNLSRAIFKDFVLKNAPRLKKIDQRNVCEDLFGKKYCFCITNDFHIECRQFYEDCDGVISFNQNTNELFEIDKKSLVIDKSPNRITSKGLRAYTAKADGHHTKFSNFLI